MEETQNNNETGTSEVDDLDLALAGYQSAIEVEPEKPLPSGSEELPSDHNTVQPIGESTGTGDWRGNPLYYQSGKKQGQMRPTMAHKEAMP